MKSNTVLMILALLAIGSLTMNAQLSRGLIAKVPFDFLAGYKSYPAGEYRVFAGPTQDILSIQSLDGKTGGFVISQRTESVKAHTKSNLVFNRYGDQYFLSQIWVQGDTSGARLRKLPAELEAAASNTGATTEIAVASR